MGGVGDGDRVPVVGELRRLSGGSGEEVGRDGKACAASDRAGREARQLAVLTTCEKAYIQLTARWSFEWRRKMEAHLLAWSASPMLRFPGFEGLNLDSNVGFG